MRKVAIASLLIILLSLPCFVYGRGEKVAVIAPSISTSREARAVLRENGLIETSFRDADAILVVVRSGLLFPLNYRYDSVKKLERDADMQLNISGRRFHVYLFQFNQDLSVSEIYHDKYDAE